MDLEPDLEIEGGAAVSRGVEEVERDAAVHPAAHQHRHPERRPPRSRAQEEVLFTDIPHTGGARRGGGERRGGRKGAKQPRRPAVADERFKAQEKGAPEERAESAEGGDDPQHVWRRRPAWRLELSAAAWRFGLGSFF